MSTPNTAPGTPTRQREPKRYRSIDAVPQQQMLEDRPFIVPIIMMLFAGACVYVTILSNVARDIMLPEHPSPDQIANFNTGIGWTAAAAIAAFILAGVFLVITTIAHAIQVSRRKPLVCAECGTKELRRGQFPRTRITDTPWEEVTCPNCAHKWYNKL